MAARKEGYVAGYGVRVADLDGDEAWLRSVAVPVDTDSERDKSLVRYLDAAMDEFIRHHKWGAASSNNIVWNRTTKPMRVIKVPNPDGKGYVTVINPEIELAGDGIFVISEGCRSVKDSALAYPVPRSCRLKLSGTMLDGKTLGKVELAYSFNPSEDGKKKNAFPIAAVQHECDHLMGVLLPDRSNFYAWLAERKEPEAKYATPALFLRFLDFPAENFAVDGREKGLYNGWAYELPSDLPLPKRLSVYVNATFAEAAQRELF